MTKSPTFRLLIGLLVTVVAIAGFSWYALFQLHRLRKLQTEIIDLNRHDSLLLLRVQSDLNAVGLKLRDMAEPLDGLGISKYRNQLAALREDLQEAIQAESRLTPVTRRPDRQTELVNSLEDFWRMSDRVFEQAAKQGEAAARGLVVTDLAERQSVLASKVSQLLERNTEAEQRADQKVATIY